MDKIKDKILNLPKQTLAILLVISILLNLGLIVLTFSQNSKLKSTSQNKLNNGYTLDYQKLYPHLYAEDLNFNFEEKENRTVYLTFDDGPSKITHKVLDILKEHDVKATFFVLYTETEEGKALYKRIVEEGHSIGVHSTNHGYAHIYHSVENFLEDFEKTHQQILEVTGVNTRLFRFPGGSINAYNRHNYQSIIAEMTRRGFIYHDWSVDSGDTANKPTADSITASVVNGISGKHASVVLLHDAGSKSYTVEALPKFIKIIKDSVYDFAPLDPTVRPMQFSYVE